MDANNHPHIRLTPEDARLRVQRAGQLFMQGFNCTQSVVVPFADLFGFTENQALRMAASFGGGIGRMRLTCGACSGMFMLAGLDCGATTGEDRMGKSHNYAVVQELAAKFEAKNGSITCKELLGLRAKEKSCVAEERTPEYYKKRPCVRMIESAAQLFADYLLEKQRADEDTADRGVQ